MPFIANFLYSFTTFQVDLMVLLNFTYFEDHRTTFVCLLSAQSIGHLLRNSLVQIYRVFKQKDLIASWLGALKLCMYFALISSYLFGYSHILMMSFSIYHTVTVPCCFYWDHMFEQNLFTFFGIQHGVFTLLTALQFLIDPFLILFETSI